MLKELVVIFISLCVLDSIMLGVIVKSIWKNTIYNIQGSPLKIRFQYAIVTYFLLTAGIYLFALPRIHSVTDCILWGGLWGLITYGIFDTTNGAVFSRYPLSTVVIDTLWGGVLVAAVCLITFSITKK
jgi:uncharacterized membrane protein